MVRQADSNFLYLEFNDFLIVLVDVLSCLQRLHDRCQDVHWSLPPQTHRQANTEMVSLHRPYRFRWSRCRLLHRCPISMLAN